MQQVSQERSLGELFTELAQETTVLVRKEVELGQAEMTAKAKTAGLDAAVIGGGALVVLLGSMVLVFALVFGLATMMPLWAAALLVGAVISIGGAILAVAGVHAIKRVDPVPRQTIQTLQEDRRWVKQELSR